MKFFKAVKRSAKEESHYPLLEEYDFRADWRNPGLLLDLRPSTLIRVNQQLVLSLFTYLQICLYLQY
jgi:hypothetical protein